MFDDCHDCGEYKKLFPWRLEPEIKVCEGCLEDRENEEDENQ